MPPRRVSPTNDGFCLSIARSTCSCGSHWRPKRVANTLGEARVSNAPAKEIATKLRSIRDDSDMLQVSSDRSLAEVPKQRKDMRFQ